MRRFALALFLVSSANAERQLDRTGVAWVLPYTKAIATAKERKRLLMIPVIAGGSSPNGCW